jgi:hypothetical protein
MFTNREINMATVESYEKDIMYAEEYREKEYKLGNTWYVSVLSDCDINTDVRILEIVGCYPDEESAVAALCIRVGDKVFLSREKLKIHIRNMCKRFGNPYNNIQFITIREMQNAEDYKCIFDRDDDEMNLDILYERPEYIMPVYNEWNYDPYATDEDSD